MNKTFFSIFLILAMSAAAPSVATVGEYVEVVKEKKAKFSKKLRKKFYEKLRKAQQFLVGMKEALERKVESFKKERAKAAKNRSEKTITRLNEEIIKLEHKIAIEEARVSYLNGYIEETF